MGTEHFTDISSEAHVDLVSHSSSAIFFDYDNDGLLDLLVCNVGKYTIDLKWPSGAYVGLEGSFGGHQYPERFEYPVLYKNMGNYRFRDVTQEVGLIPHVWSGDATFCDLNLDGWPDLFILNMQGHSHYFENEGGKRFVEQDRPVLPQDTVGRDGDQVLRFRQ